MKKSHNAKDCPSGHLVTEQAELLLEERRTDSKEAERALFVKPITIPDKNYLRIGEVADILGVKPHVLRYWETEFRQIRPNKSRNGQRLYRRRDVEVLAMVQGLLHNERYTIVGARDRLEELLNQKSDLSECIGVAGREVLERARGEIAEILLLLEKRERDLEERNRREWL